MALPLLFEACALQGPDRPSALHLYWAVLLGWIIVRGSGAISVDALLSRGLVSTAIPGTAALGRATGTATRILEPWYRLALRLWIATAPLAVGATVLGFGGSGMREQLGAWLASYPQTMGAAPFVSLIVAGPLISGFGTRIVAIALVLALPLSRATMQLDERLYWALALGILILRGPGPFSLDRLVEGAFRRTARREAPKDESLPHVVVVGGGFGGIAAARGLAGAACRVTLVDRRYHLFQPLLYQVATAGLSPADIATPIRSLFRLQPNVRVLLGEVVGVRPETHEVMVGRSSLAYDARRG